MDFPHLLTTCGDRGLCLVAVAYYHATHLFVYNFSYVVIMSIHNSALMTDFSAVSERG